MYCCLFSGNWLPWFVYPYLTQVGSESLTKLQTIVFLILGLENYIVNKGLIIEVEILMNDN